MGHLSFSEILDTSLKVSWQEPLEKNGILTGGDAEPQPCSICLHQPHSISPQSLTLQQLALQPCSTSRDPIPAALPYALLSPTGWVTGS